MLRMSRIDWKEEVEKRKEHLLEDTKGLLKIRSVLDETNGKQGAPFGPEIEQALSYMLQLGEKSAMTVKNVDGYAGHIEIGSGDELVGILCHVDVVPAGEGWTMDLLALILRTERFLPGVQLMIKDQRWLLFMR
jgi:succinyl-diaminopimelate desuccinylase